MTSAEFSPPPYVPKPDGTCYLVLCRDGPGAAELRALHLEGHLEHVERHWTRYITAGPLREPGGEALVGSLFLVMGSSLREVKALMEADPYLNCGMYASVEYKEFTNSIGQFIGGKIWPSREAIRHRAAGGPTDDLSKGLSS